MDKKKFSIKGNIRNKLISILVLLAIVPLIVMGTLVINKFNKIMLDNIETSTQQSLDLIEDNIDLTFDKYEGFLNTLKTYDGYSGVSPTDNVAIKEIEKNMSYVVESDKTILNSYTAYPDKRLSSYPPVNLPKDYDPTTREWYVEAVNKPGEIHYMDPYTDAATGQTVITISTVVENRGKFVGVLAFDIEINNISDSLSKINIGENGFVHLIDPSGLTIAHPEIEKVGKQVDTEWIEDISNTEKNFKKYKDNGESVFIGHETDEHTGWKIVVSISENELTKYTNQLRNMILTTVTIIIILSTILAVIIAEYVNKTMKKIEVAFAKASQGELDMEVDVKTGDEFEDLGNSFNTMMTSLRELVNDIHTSSKTILETSQTMTASSNQASIALDEVSITIDQLAQGSISQAEDMVEGVNEVNDLAEGIQAIDKLANDMGNKTEGATELSKEGLTQIRVLLEKTEEVNKSTSEMISAMEDMETVTSEIGLITDTINGIAEQTNLLALNAAIEAARAGESGRGFSVVADEIRKLAEQSSQATNTIQNLITDIQNKSRTASGVMRDAGEVVTEQTDSVESTREVFDRISETIESLMTSIGYIKTTVNTTSGNKDMLMEKMVNISSVSEQSSASTQEVSAATEEINATMMEFTDTAVILENLSEELSEKLSKFKV